MPKWVKIAVFGDKEVGKTAIIEQLISGRHNVGQVSVFYSQTSTIPN